MRILFLDAYFEPEQIAFTHLENDILEGLVNAGHDVNIICPTPTRGVNKDIAKVYKRRKSETLYHEHVHVTRFSAPHEGKSLFIRALRYLWCNLRTYQIGRRQTNIDAVFANSTPPTQGLIAGMVAKKLNAPFVYSLQDIFPDSLVNTGLTKKGSLLWKLGRKIENKTYKGANKIIAISESFKTHLIEKGVNPKKVVVIPNWIDTSEVFDIPRLENKIIKRYNLTPDKFYVCYSGNIGYSQNLELLVEVAKEIKTETEQIEFIIIGEGAAKEQLKHLIEINEVSNIHLLPFQPYEDIAHVFSLGDVGLIISKPGIGGSSVPSKTWSIMAAKRPVLASFDEGELTRIISDIGCGFVAKAGNKVELVDAIMQSFSDSNNLQMISENGYKYVSEEINRTKCVTHYIQVLEERFI